LVSCSGTPRHLGGARGSNQQLSCCQTTTPYLHILDFFVLVFKGKNISTDNAGELGVPGTEGGEGRGNARADDAGEEVFTAAATAECSDAAADTTDVLSLSSSSQDQLLDGEHLEECPLCLLSQPRCHFPRLTSCAHRACSDCLRQYLRIEISESRVGIACPQCSEPLAPLDVRAILDDRALLDRFEEYQLRRFLAADPDTRWCPAPDCR